MVRYSTFVMCLCTNQWRPGSLACSPFHVRFGKFSLLRPYEKKVCHPCSTIRALLTARQVEFKVNGIKQDHAMKLGEGGEAFFVFETSDEIPASLQTSPVVSPATSPPGLALQDTHSIPALQEPEFLDLAADSQDHLTYPSSSSPSRPTISSERRAQSDYGEIALHPKSYRGC